MGGGGEAEGREARGVNCENVGVKIRIRSPSNKEINRLMCVNSLRQLQIMSNMSLHSYPSH